MFPFGFLVGLGLFWRVNANNPLPDTQYGLGLAHFPVCRLAALSQRELGNFFLDCRGNTVYSAMFRD